MKFPKVNPKQSFPEMEEAMLAFWAENKIFEKSVDTREWAEEFNFFDGPPFATGTPHYGHILAGTIKDVIPRYQTMKGKKVERRFGWDCHGLPIENIVEKKLKISGKDDIEKNIGVHKFNETCRENVFGYVDEWKKTVNRMGRWVDMENDYKTMDRDFMESVWWVYKSMYDKGLIYEGYKVVPYCPRCSTPLSNFEVNQGYKDIQDKTITAKFKLTNSDKYVLAWTTTPWTLAANLGLAVGVDLDYVELEDNSNGETYILARDRVAGYYKNEDDYTIHREFKGSELVGMKYEPINSAFADMDELPQGSELGENAFTVIKGHHVTTESGTGIVHIAPAYGEDDYMIGKEEKLGFVSHIDDAGKVEHIPEAEWTWVFEYNEQAIQDLKQAGKSVKIDSYVHSYPHCWRCDSKLIYRAISAWYVAVEQIRDNMVSNNKNINWIPWIIRDGRMGKWLEGARDWNISRNRYWGSAIPVWQNEDKSSEVCIGSVEELYEANKDYGQIEHKDWEYYFTSTWEVVDIHKHFVDEIFVKNEKNTVAKSVLGIHGCGSSIEKPSWLNRKKLFEENGMSFDTYQFNEDKDPTYESWEEVFHTIDFSKYDCIYTSSMGGMMTIRYLSENNIKVPRLFMAVPGLSNKTINGEKKNVQAVWDSLSESDYKNIADEVIIAHAKDDDVVPYENAVKLAKQTEATMLTLETGGHKLWENHHLLSAVCQFGAPLKRIPEVLDCWFESGSMPYASKHYPFDGESDFKFPADFIAEGLDQTRGWFYTLIILGTGLFDTAPMKNVIVNGIILAEDGKKMSKSLQNYPDPKLIFDKYGADAMRFYLMNSPVVEAQDFRFAESGVEEVVKKVLLPLWNTYYFFTTYANIDNFSPAGLPSKLDNKLDIWLISELNTLSKEVGEGLDWYKLADAARPILAFMDNLTNWYIRRSRKRFWKSENDGDKMQAYETLYYTLVEATKIIAPFMPFMSEYMYKNLTNWESVHLDMFPTADESLIDTKLSEDTSKVQNIITLGLAWRANNKVRVRQPLQSITITTDLPEYFKDILKEELNVKEVLVVDGSTIASKICKPNGRAIGPKFGKDVKFIMSEAKAGNFEELSNGNVKVGHFELEAGDFELVFEVKDSELKIEAGYGMVIAMDDNITDELRLEWDARDIVRHIQEARKDAGYKVDDRISINIITPELDDILKVYNIESETLSTLDRDLGHGDLEKDIEVESGMVKIILKK